MFLHLSVIHSVYRGGVVDTPGPRGRPPSPDPEADPPTCTQRQTLTPSPDPEADTLRNPEADTPDPEADTTPG